MREMHFPLAGEEVEPEPWSQARRDSRSTEPGSEGTWQTGEGVKRREQVTVGKYREGH